MKLYEPCTLSNSATAYDVIVIGCGNAGLAAASARAWVGRCADRT